MNRLPDNPEFHLAASACHSEGACYRVVIETKEDLGPLMPYINAELSVVTYEPDEEEPVLIFKAEGFRVALRRHEIAIGSVEDKGQALAAARGITAVLNRVIERMDSITPDHRPRRRPPALEIFKLLPGTNCGECGEAACLAFAVKLSLGRLEPEICTYVKEQGKALKEIYRLLGRDFTPSEQVSDSR